MRVVGTIAHENYAKKFSAYLKRQGIANNFEGSFDSRSGQMSYQLWIHDEDRLEEARLYLNQFEEHPSDVKYEIVEEVVETEELEPPTPPPARFGTHLTLFIIALCTFVFFLTFLQDLSIPEDQPHISALQEKLLYDFPPGVEQDVEHASYWKGLYSVVVAKITGKPLSSGPMFYQIRQGQIWRLFTPILLHNDLLHIAFNMLWLWALGRPIEARIGALRTLCLIIIAAFATNTLQYLMSGPFFLGFSGVIAAMAGFIWMREKIAPWEGYPVTKGTFLFLAVFILAILGLQVVSFIIEVSTNRQFAPQIANTAHIAGAIVGILLARLNFFARKGAM